MRRAQYIDIKYLATTGHLMNRGFWDGIVLACLHGDGPRIYGLTVDATEGFGQFTTS